MKYFSLFDIWKKSAEKFGDKVALTDNTGTVKISYKEAFRKVCFLAQKIKDFGLERFDKVSLFAINSPEWLIIEQSIITNGAVCVSKTSEISIEELEYVYTNSDSVALITDNENIINAFLEKIPEFAEKAKFIIYTGDNEIAENPKIHKLKEIFEKLNENTEVKADWAENPEDTAYINYTSGTSSNPKGAMLPNIGMAYVVEELQRFNQIKEDKTFVVTFPLSSAGGKSFNILCLSEGVCLIYTQYKDFYNVLEKYKPDYIHCAPKIIQTMHSKMLDSVKSKGFLFEKIYNFAYSISSRILNFERKYFYNDKFLFLKGLINCVKTAVDKTIFKPVRNSLFKDDVTVFVGSAHLAKPLEDFLQIMNIRHVQHYGLTETTGIDVSNTPESQKKHPYTVGIPFKETVLKIIDPESHEEMKKGEVGLITLQGPEILKAYYKNEEATKKAILEEHYLNTGDLGYIDENGYLTVLSRYDDVIVMSNGYNVYTPLLENEAKDSEFVTQIAIAGHGRPYLTALILLNNEEYNKWCKDNNSQISNANQNKKFKEFLIEHLNEKIKRKNNHKYYEKLKNLCFINEEFTFENGMLTGTLKVKYKKVINTYKNEIEKMYEEIEFWLEKKTKR